MAVQSLTSTAVDPASIELIRWLERIRRQLDRCHQRQLLSIVGDDEWCQRIYRELLQQFEDTVLLSDRSELPQALPFSKSETLLGSETRLVVVDLFSGLNADLVCIAAGLVECGGLLVIMSPGADRWQEINDPYGVWQNGSSSIGHRFVSYFFDAIDQASVACISLRQDKRPPSPVDLPVLAPTEIINGKSLEQARALDEIKQWFSTGKEKIALLTADRGRGKSTCLGIAIKELIDDRGYSVIVTAYSRQSANMLLSQCDEVDFWAPDMLLEKQPTADLLVIDEAAMLPHSMLTRLCMHFDRILMATTTGGYEGTGQGFLLRFVARLGAGQLTRLKLQRPVRWAENDILENWVNRTFLLESSPAQEPSESLIQLSEFRVEAIDRDTDSGSLKAIYRLLTFAHYRSRPSDFRALMENPDSTPFAAKQHGRLLGTALANREGGFDRTLDKEVFFGRRRPKGHLLAQMLTAQAGLSGFSCYKGLRIQRIAVAEPSRLRGIGRGLIDGIENSAISNDMDYIGACFALDSDSAGFWRSCGFRLVHIGHGRGKSTGNHSIAVVKIINPDLEPGIAQLEHKLRSSLSLAFVQNLRQMPAEDVVALLRFANYRTELSKIEEDEVLAFTLGDKGFDLSFASLQKAVMRFISASAEDRVIHPWLVEKAIQNRSWSDLISNTAYSGKKAVTKKLRELTGELLTFKTG